MDGQQVFLAPSDCPTAFAGTTDASGKRQRLQLKACLLEEAEAELLLLVARLASSGLTFLLF